MNNWRKRMQENNSYPYFYIASSSSGPYFSRYDDKEDVVYLSSNLICKFSSEVDVRRQYQKILVSCKDTLKNLGLKCYMVYSDYNIVQFDPEPNIPKQEEKWYIFKKGKGYLSDPKRSFYYRYTDWVHNAMSFDSLEECMDYYYLHGFNLDEDIVHTNVAPPIHPDRNGGSTNKRNSEVEKLESEICSLKEQIKDIEHKSKVSESLHKSRIYDLKERVRLIDCHITNAYANIKDIINDIKTS